MPEQPSEATGEHDKLSFLDEHSPSDEDEYIKGRIAQRDKGIDTWMVRSFDADDGRVYDFYVDGMLVGLVDHDYPSDAYTAYMLDYGPDITFEIEVYRGKSAPIAVRAVEVSAKQAS